jgi:hypothetical protein
MELTPERKRQIEDEERQRLAEEQYRAQARAALAGPTSAPATHGQQEPRKSHAGLLIGIIAIAALAAVVLVNVHAARSSQKIASGQIVVKAHNYVQYRIEITPDMRDARLIGSFNASGGSGNDVEAVIATEPEYSNWINGHQAHVYYGTQGRKTTGSFNLRLTPGTYYFAVSNRFSAFSDKYVFLNVDLSYRKMLAY